MTWDITQLFLFFLKKKQVLALSSDQQLWGGFPVKEEK